MSRQKLPLFLMALINSTYLRLFIFLFLLLGINQLAYGQSFKALLRAGDNAFKVENYYAAMTYYQEALLKKDKNLHAIYRYAETARSIYAYEVALNYYNKILTAKAEKDFPILQLRIGQVKKGQGSYEGAIYHLEQFIKSGKGNEEELQLGKQELEDCLWALEILAEPDETEIAHLNKKINTPFTEFGPLMKGDTLFYSSHRYDWKSDDHIPKRKLTKVLYSLNGGRGRPIPRGFNEKDKITAHLTIGQGGVMYYTSCVYKTSTQIECKIYARGKDRRGRWAKPEQLPDNINVEGSTTTHPHLVYDPVHNREMLFFASNRPGGKGGLDIYMTWKKSNEKFADPINLEVINTPGNEITPFYHLPTQTLYFSTDGRPNLGGYDIYHVKFDGNEHWGAPVHGGYPLNSSYNDIYFSMTNDSTVGYFSSNREGAFYLDKDHKSCCNDIFKVTFKAEKESIPPLPDSTIVTIDSNKLEISPLPLDPLVDVPSPDIPVIKPPERLEDFLPLALYFDNDEPDKRTRKTTTKKNYETTYNDFYPRKYEFIDEYTGPLSEVAKEEAAWEIDRFFEDKVKRGNEYLMLFSTILLDRLKEGETVEIFIKGFTSPRAKSNYNLSLGKRRVSSVKNHFRAYQDGVFLPYIDSGQLILTERSFGETTAATTISDDLNDQRNSIYSVSASLERRVEIVEIKRSGGK